MVLIRKAESGFTLIELLVVMSIISMLSSVTLASLSLARKNAKNGKFASQITQTHTAIVSHKLDNSSPPPLPSPSPSVSNDEARAILTSALVPKYLATLPEGLSAVNNTNVYYTTAPNLPLQGQLGSRHCGSASAPAATEYLLSFDYNLAGGTFPGKRLYQNTGYGITATTLYCIGE